MYFRVQSSAGYFWVQLATCDSQFADRLFLFSNHFEHFFKKFANQNFLSFRIFVVRETTKFLLTLQSRQFAYILIPNVLNCTQFFYIGLHFAPNPKLWRLQRNPIPPSRWNFSPNNSNQVCFQWNTFCDHSKIFSLYMLLSQLHV